MFMPYIRSRFNNLLFSKPEFAIVCRDITGLLLVSNDFATLKSTGRKLFGNIGKSDETGTGIMQGK